MNNLFSWFVNAALGLVNIVIGLFPNADATSVAFIQGYLSTFKDYFWGSDWILPVHDFAFGIELAIAVELTMWGVRFTEWILSVATLGIYKRLLK